MYELGYNLGLDHYGDMAQCSHTGHQNDEYSNGNGCPLYVSVMSYYYVNNNGIWPSNWEGLPNYGRKPGTWNDWDNLIFEMNIVQIN